MNEGVKLRECTERGRVEPNEPAVQRESYETLIQYPAANLDKTEANT